MGLPLIKSVNTILYCVNWQATVNFYRHTLQLPMTFETDWFIEFSLGGSAHLSIANERRARIKSSRGLGVTLALQVDSVDEAREHLRRCGLEPEPIMKHAWGARTFYCRDPEGYRLEFWSQQ